MASCDDDFALLSDDPQSHHHDHHSHHNPNPNPNPNPHFHLHQPFPPHRFAPKLSPSLHPHSLLAGSPKKVVSVAGVTDAGEDPDDYSDTGFCSQADTKCPPSFHNVNPFEQDPNPFAHEDEENTDQKSRSRADKRKDREELSDGGTDYCFKKSKPGNSGNPNTGDYKKDREEWSDSAIGCLLDAYTEKYVQLNRGNLRGRDWEDVAGIVSERCEKQKACKSVEQCKNKVDNLKKRYKAERQRLSNGSLSVSHWPWFKKMEQIVGSSASSKALSDEDKSVGGSGGSVLRQTKRYAAATPSPVGLANNLKTKSLSNPRWRRVVFKISGAALVGNGPQNVDPKVTSLIAREVAMANRLGVEVAIVVGGRNFFCGGTWVAATGLDRTTAYQIGMMATVMNSILLQASLDKLGVQTRVQTAFSMQEIAEPYIRRRAIRHLEKGRVVIFGGIGAGTGNPLFTTDTAVALRASEINADAVLKGTNADIYECHSRNSNGVAFEHISYREFVSRGFTAMDMTALTFCEENGIPVVIFNLLEQGNISRALCGDQVGTLIDQSGRIS
ncbi:aspartate/glutamate/uridylate kinase family protein [Tasmannia lanceolata]|uniref:aspartate/glutamate/uridylate kinase family protein n=1 Tax=Tasmannia lanceolata TaxID=3420 RepID=UPI004063CA49